MASFHSTSPCSILLVEDDKATREVVRLMVASKFPQCTIYTAEQGKKGVKVYMEHTPDLVVTDVNMPDMDGIEMTRAIKAINPNTTTIVLSGRNENVEKFKDIGYCAYLMKPLDFNDLFNAIKKCHPKLRHNI